MPTRGFCVALWPRLELGFADDVPEELQPRTALEAPLRRLVGAHPALRGYLNTGMTGNYDIGHYVPPPLVPKLRAYVESVLDRVRSDDVAVVEVLAGVLRVAESRGLAYWEATDMPVANGNGAWLEDAARAVEVEERAQAGNAAHARCRRRANGAPPRGKRDRRGVVDVCQDGVADRCPHDRGAHAAPALVSSVACAADGRVFAAAFRHDKRGYGCYELDLEGAALREVAVPGVSDIEAIVRVGDRVLVLPTRPDMYKRGAKPAWLDGEVFDITEKPEELFAADFGDGTAFANDQTHGPSRFAARGGRWRLALLHAEPTPAVVRGSACRKIGTAGSLGITTDGAVFNDLAAGGAFLTVECPVASAAQGTITFATSSVVYLDQSTSSITCTLRAEDAGSTAANSLTVSSISDDNIYRQLSLSGLQGFAEGQMHLRYAGW
jgi:hypothetical protein